MNNLKNKRKGLSAKVDALKAIVDVHATTPLDEKDVKQCMEQVENLTQSNDSLFDDIVALCKDDNDITVNHQIYDDEAKRIRAIEKRLQIIQDSFPQPIIATTGHSAPPKTDVRLPKLELPAFSGDLQEWISFQDLFTASVHNNRQLSGAQKLQYLKSAVKGEPSLLIQSISVTNANYAEAWKILTDRYQNQREIVKSILDRILNLSAMQQESSTNLRKLVDTTKECVRAFEVMGISNEQVGEQFIIQIISKKLDSESRRQWELSLTTDNLPKFDEFSKFLDRHARGIAAAQVQSVKPKAQPSSSNAPKAKAAVHHGAANDKHICCGVCDGEYWINRCQIYLTLSVPERKLKVRAKQLCFNCLKPNHTAQQCKSENTCKKCHKKHHTTLHSDEAASAPPITPSTPVENQTTTTNLHVRDYADFSQVHLCTALVKVCDKRGEKQLVRVMLDSASQASIISEACVQRLGLNRKTIHVPLSGLATAEVGSAKSITSFSVYSCVNDLFNVDINALIMPKVTGNLPHRRCDPDVWIHLKGLQLADPNYHVPGPCDILLGGSHFAKFLRGGVRHGPPGSPSAFETVFGWVISGEDISTNTVQPVSAFFTDCNLDTVLQKFWDIEEIPTETNHTEEEVIVEEHFQKTHRRDETGRFIVKLPIKPNTPDLGDSRDLAIRRLKQVERRLSKNSEYREQYLDFMAEYRRLGHMEPVSDKEVLSPPANTYYIPHLFVLKEDSTTTKFRVVFDASAKTASGISLNENHNWTNNSA